MPTLVYRMPVAVLGERVLYYVDGDTNAPPQFGTVVESGACSCTVRLMVRTGIDPVKYDVPHVSDPRIANAEIRRNGAWDFHPDTLKLRNLEDRLNKLEESLGN